MEVLSSAGGLQVLPRDWWSTWDVIISLSHETSPGSFSPPFPSFLPCSQHLSLSLSVSLSLCVSLSVSLSVCLSLSLSLPFCLDSLSYHLPPTIFLSHVPFNQLPLSLFLPPVIFPLLSPPFFLTSQSFDLLLSFTLLIIVWVCCRHLVLMSFCLNQVYFLCSLRPQTDVSPLSKCCSVLMNAAGSGDVHSVRLYLLQGFWIVINIFTDTFFYFFSPDNHRRM